MEVWVPNGGNFCPPGTYSHPICRNVRFNDDVNVVHPSPSPCPNSGNNNGGYFNNEFSVYDSICQFQPNNNDNNEDKPQQQQSNENCQPRYYATPHFPHNYNFQGISNGNSYPQPAEISLDPSGAINLQLPCVSNEPLCKPSKRIRRPCDNLKNQKATQKGKASGKQPGSFKKIPSESSSKTSLSRTASSTPFCATVRSSSGLGGKSSQISRQTVPLSKPNKNKGSNCVDVSAGRNKTTIKWDFHSGLPPHTSKVDYGQELYEAAARNLARQLQAQIKITEETRRKEKKFQKSSSSSQKGRTAGIGDNGSKEEDNEDKEEEDNCYDYSKPAFNSSLKTSAQLTEQLERLKNLPQEVEKMFKADKRFEPVIANRASKALNMDRDAKVFKDLIPLDPADQLKEQVSKAVLEQMESVKPAPRPKDPLPNLADYQSPSFSRIKPKQAELPDKPDGPEISAHLSADYDVGLAEAAAVEEASWISVLDNLMLEEEEEEEEQISDQQEENDN